MNEEVFNMSVRKFLKKLGVTAQREIELAVREQLESGDLQGDETLEATATVTITGLSRDVGERRALGRGPASHGFPSSKLFRSLLIARCAVNLAPGPEPDR